ncbi:MAG TPA: hypothetical protein VMH32_25185 [Burkholderiales bacterium]|nr:hypothetical protein [Burkholderiales bacterium]
MWDSVLRHVPSTAVFLAALLGAGCTTVPQQEFKSYTEAFAEVKSTTEQLLVEYDAARQAEDAYKQAKTAAEKAAEEAKKGTKQAPALLPPFPPSVTLTLATESRRPPDPVGARRQALEVVADFNTALVSLAEGKKPEQVKSSIDSLTGGLSNVAKLAGTSLPIPFAGEISTLLSTVITKLDEARNRQQFVAALKEAEPIIRGILRLFAEDAQDIYQIRAGQATRAWTSHQDAVIKLVKQMRDIAKECDRPTVDQAKKLDALEKEVRALLDRAGLKDNSEKLPTTDGAHQQFDELALSQLQQTLVQAQGEADKYEAVIKAQTALLALVVSYGRMLAQTDATLIAVRKALDNPADIREQATELIGFVFTVKRDWEALNAARRAAA